MTPAAALRDAAEAKHRPGDELTLMTDAQSYKDRVLIAIVRPEWACVVQVDRDEYDGMKLASMAGFCSPEASAK